MPTAPDGDLLQMDGWPLGVNNRARETEPGMATNVRGRMSTSLYLREAINVDLTRYGHPLRRKGYSQVASGFTHSLWSDHALDYGLCVHEGELCKVGSSGGLTALREVHAYAPMSYATVNREVFWSNGVNMGRVDSTGALHWSLPKPPVPVAQAVSGDLPPGRYRIASVYVDEFDEEYGASDEVVVDVVEGQAVDVTIPGGWPAEAAAVRVFASQPDGEILYDVTTGTAPGTFTLQRNMLGRGREIETLNLEPPKPATIVRYFNGRIYTARHDTVVFSEALRYGLTRPAQGIYMFPSNVTLLEPVADGVYVGSTEGVVFLQGMDPYDVQQVNVLSHSPVPRASTRVPGEFFEVNEGMVPVWWGHDGAMVAGLTGGRVEQLSKDRLAVPRFNAGAMMYREQEGMAHVVSSLQKGGEDSAMGASDSVVATVRRNTTKLNC